MKELLATIFQYGPRYLEDLLSLITRPKQSLLILLSQDDAVVRSLFFFLASLGLTLMFELVLLPKDVSLQMWIAKHLTLHVMGAIGTALIIHISFAIVRGKASPMKFLVIVFYLSGVWFLISGLLITSAKGLVLSAIPEYYSKFVDLVNTIFMPFYEKDYFDLTDPAFLFETISLEPHIALLLIYATFYGEVIWVVICWGAFRQVSGVSRVRSLVAFLLTKFFGFIWWYIFAAVMVQLQIMLF